MNVRRLVTGAFLGSLMVGPPAFSAGIAVLAQRLSDNGDGDGFADTRETVTWRLTLQNTTGAALSGLALHVTTTDSALACVTNPTIAVGTLLPGEVRETDQGFEFLVNDIDRSALGLDPYDDLSIHFDLTATTDPPATTPKVYPWRLSLDLDLDVSGGAGASTFFESFEEGLGAFEVENLDAMHYDLASSDGYRCQYLDPDWVNSFTYGVPEATAECYMNVSPLHADAIWWGVSGPETSPGGGRGFSGFHALFYGIDMGAPLNWTTPIGSLEAVATTQPIALGWDAVTPLLSIKHQASLIDGRASDLIESQTPGAGAGADPTEAFDRAVVLVQLADDQGNRVGPWIKLDPSTNVYDQQGTDNFANCMFDPIDDGSTEDSFFDPQDPARLYGPSSTCFPEYVFAAVGDTDMPFDPENLGQADGPALQGVWGLGTWVESKFDLSRFRGRSIRLRFLASAMQILPNEDWEVYLDWNPNPGDNGWWIDDITVSGALSSPPTVVGDLHDNSGLPGTPAAADPDSDAVCSATDNCPGVNNPDQADGDLDGAGMACDCNDLYDKSFPGAAEVNDGLDNQCAGDAGYGVVDEISGTTGFFDPEDKDSYSWPPQAGAMRYQVARATSPNFTSGCVAFPSTSNTYFSDHQPLFPGAVHYYLVRAFYPNIGSWGQNSSGQEKTVPCAL